MTDTVAATPNAAKPKEKKPRKASGERLRTAEWYREQAEKAAKREAAELKANTEKATANARNQAAFTIKLSATQFHANVKKGDTNAALQTDFDRLLAYAFAASNTLGLSFNHPESIMT